MTNQLSFITQQNWRTEWQYNINKRMTVRNRVQVIWYDKRNPDYSQVYVYENDVPYSFSIPFCYEEGMRYYLNLN